MASSDAFLRQLSSRGRKPTSKRWANEGGLNSMRYDGSSGAAGAYVMKKRVMVIVDQSAHSKHAMMWALTHVTNKGDLLTLLHIIPCNKAPGNSSSSSHYLVTTHGSLCKASKPEVEVEALVIQGPKKATVMGQVKKLEVSVLVLGQKKPSLFLTCMSLKSSTEKFVEECIDTVECLTIGVRKQSNGVGGYLISTRWHKNFWLLA